MVGAGNALSRCIVVIPTYNEAENLPLLVPQVLEQDRRVEILVVDDESDVVTIVKAMPAGKLKNIQAEFKTDGEQEVLHRLFMEIAELTNGRQP